MIRVRFAPSPTGFLHQGNVRTALFNFLFARRQGGKLVLRIEDTDQERSQEDYVQAIFKDMEWLGLKADEGAGQSGEFGPYRQMERLGIYQKYLSQLIEAGKVYSCYCTPEELDTERRKAMANGKAYLYSQKCRTLGSEELAAKEAAGVSPSLRFKVDREIVKFNDLVYGEKVFDTATIGDFVVARSSQVPIYLFACALDDCLMQITHVIRGEDGMSNTPRQILLMRAMGFEPPAFAHLPLILGPDHSLLSKRNGSTPVSDFKKLGYLPEALLNYLALLGWAPPKGPEVLTLAELVEKFDLSRVSRSSAIFDWDKLNHINQAFLRELPEEQYLAMCRDFLKAQGVETPAEEDRLTQTLRAVRWNLKTFGDLPLWMDWLLHEPSAKTDEAKAVLETPETGKVLKTLSDLVQLESEELGRDSYDKLVEELKKKTKIKGKKLFMPIRVALTGSVEGPELANLLPTLGKNKVLERIHRAIENLQHPKPQ